MVETILFVTKNEQTRDIARRLKGLSVPAYYIPHYLYADISSIPNLWDASAVVDLHKPRLNYLEFHVADHCNLNCKGCTHYSNLVSHASFPDYTKVMQDFRRLKELFWGIDRIRILGGEPLLNPDLWKYVESIREIFPDTDLRVVTNGLLVPKISPELISAMKNAHAVFDITNYTPTDTLRSDITHKLDTAAVSYSYAEGTKIKFAKILTRQPTNNASEAYRHCFGNTCNFLRDGILSTCPTVALSGKLNEAYDMTYPTDAGNNIYTVRDPWKLYEDLNRPIDFCRYCSPALEWFDWEQCPGKYARAADWIVDDAKIPKLILQGKIRWGTNHITDPKAAISRDLDHFPVLKDHVLTVYRRLFPPK